MEHVFLASAVRTPHGRRDGALSSIHPTRLLGSSQRAAIVAAGIDPERVTQVLGGCVAQVGEQSFNVTRTAWLAEGLPISTAATTVDAQCGSSQQAFTLAVGQIAGGLADCVVACGVESMSRLPIGSNFRKEHGLGRPLPKAYAEHFSFGNQYQAAERIAELYGVSREAADAWGIRSQERAAAAWDRELFAGQLAPLPADETGQAVALARDEGLRAPDPAKIAALEPVIAGGVHTAASASQIADGASAVLLVSGRLLDSLNLQPLARVVDSTIVGVDPETMLLGPHRATPLLLERNALTVSDLAHIEVNEAFASIVLSFIDEVKADPEQVNPNGGAIAMGHPLGATGCSLITRSAHELARTGGAYSLVTMCCGGGLGTATLLQRP
jgi:acetyl-CoA C-acetyltransferase